MSDSDLVAKLLAGANADIVRRLRTASEFFALGSQLPEEAAATIERLTKERDDAERQHQDFRLQNDREWKAKVDHQKAELAKAREALEPFHKLDRQIVQGHLDGHVADDDKIYARVGDIRKASDTFAALAPEGK